MVPPVDKRKLSELRSKSATTESRTRREMIDACSRFCHLMGLPRSIGQIYGLLYLSASPLSLDDLVSILNISKGSASTGTRQLSQWGAIRQIWISGDRRDYYEVVADLVEFIRASYQNYVRPRLHATTLRLDSLTSSLDEDAARGLLTPDELRLCSERIKALARIQGKLRLVLPMAEKLML